MVQYGSSSPELHHLGWDELRIMRKGRKGLVKRVYGARRVPVFVYFACFAVEKIRVHSCSSVVGIHSPRNRFL